MAKIPSNAIIDFVEVYDHKKFKILYRTASGEAMKYPAWLSIEALDDAGKARLMARVNERITPSKQ